jgi:hypothetical protein
MNIYRYQLLSPKPQKIESTNIALEKGTHGSDVMGRFCGRGTPFQALCFFERGQRWELFINGAKHTG